MNKMIKGAAVAGVGVALLLGGGGTLAVWNDAKASEAGAIVAGDLELQAAEGTWKSNVSGPIASISDYRIVPGEKLTYQQKLTVHLEGDKLQAKLDVTGVPTNGFTAKNVKVEETTLKYGDEVIPAVLDERSPKTVTASTTFEFLSTTDKREDVKATYDLSNVGYKLEQIAPGDNDDN